MLVCRHTLVLLLAGTVFVLPSAPARACNIPVFRYSVDHWPSDAYRLTVFHHGPLTAENRDRLNAFEKHSDSETPVLLLELVDLAKTPEGVPGLPLPPAGSELPWLVVQYPAPTRIHEPVWSGPLQGDVPAALLDSPARRELAHRIRGGDSAVWILLASGDTAKDDDAEKRLRTEVQRLAKELKLPERTAAPEDQLPDDRPLKLAFSVLRVARNDPAEAMLVRMLVNTEDDLAGRSDTMVFPVFGRGRALPALVGAGITPGNIEDAAKFLAGPCTCEVKRDNPGVDLLMTADWGLPATKPPTASPVPGGMTVPIPQRVPAPTPAAESPLADDSVSLSAWWYLLVVGVVIAGVMAVFTGTMIFRSPRRLTQ